MARPKSNGSYAPLSATYFRDDAILEAGPDAELLFVRVLAFLSDASSDGFITDRQIRFAVGYGLRNVQKRITTLQEVGLLEAVAGGFTPRSWHKWNKTAEEIGKNLKRDRERKAQKAAENTHNSARNESGNETDSAAQYKAKQSKALQSNTTSDVDTSDPEFSDDVNRLCALLAELIHANGSRAAVGKNWLISCDRLIRLDGYTPEQIEWVIRWCQQSDFWAPNILSMPTLRSKFEQLKAQGLSEHKRKKPTKQEAVIDVLEMGQRLQDEADRKAVGA